MNEATPEKLIQDADLVADVGVRLGRIKDPTFLDALGNARQALAADTVSPQVVAGLQKSLNSAINDIAPITLGDINSGWRPFSVSLGGRLGNCFFSLFCFLLLIGTAYATQLYDRASSLYTTTMELQEIRGAEQAIRLFGLLQKNKQEVIESLTNGSKDFLYESFNKALFDLEIMNMKFQAYGPIAADVLYDLDIKSRLYDWLTGKPVADQQNPSRDARIEGWIKEYGQTSGGGDQAATSTPAPMEDLTNKNLKSVLQVYFKDIRDFTSTINVNFDPLSPNDYSYYTYRLRAHMSILGSWVLPGLYGMLGAVIFHMRRLLDQSLPNPSWLRFTYRIVLGGFAGIILVWFLTPSSQTLSHPAFATLTAFGLAFLVGFSTDIFFQTLDRLITYLSQAIGKAEFKAE
ncbi:MAG: hypothetical protein IPK78_20595 [Rhodospirillales bacterium]|nr:hypothetical protein [Rhodospirillales bacterium]